MSSSVRGDMPGRSCKMGWSAIWQPSHGTQCRGVTSSWRSARHSIFPVKLMVLNVASRSGVPARRGDGPAAAASLRRGRHGARPGRSHAAVLGAGAARRGDDPRAAAGRRGHGGRRRRLPAGAAAAVAAGPNQPPRQVCCTLTGTPILRAVVFLHSKASLSR